MPDFHSLLQVEDTLLMPEKKDGMEIVRVEKSVKVGNDIRPVGFDLPANATVLTKGTLLRPAEIGILATVGCTEVKCIKPPVVAVMSTGDEVVEPSQPLQPGFVILVPHLGARNLSLTLMEYVSVKYVTAIDTPCLLR
jgi:gephyrin